MLQPRLLLFLLLIYFYIFTFLVPPDIQLSGPQHAVREGENVSITCIINEGSPRPEIHWSKNNKPLKGENDTVLRLTWITADHEGTYTCKAENKGGSSNDSMFITVDSKS